MFFLPAFVPIFSSAYDKLRQKQYLRKELSVSYRDMLEIFFL